MCKLLYLLARANCISLQISTEFSLEQGLRKCQHLLRSSAYAEDYAIEFMIFHLLRNKHTL